ncbi:MAG TPA: hypothetical protein VFA43_03635 [Gemmatimonadaceae bacterium]|nr:hypothetical protein [Gemmatimonadaceae bacterium]
MRENLPTPRALCGTCHPKARAAPIGEMKRAALDDGKNIDEEDNPQARGLEHRILDHIDRATHAAERAHHAWMQEMGK